MESGKIHTIEFGANQYYERHFHITDCQSFNQCDSPSCLPSHTRVFWHTYSNEKIEAQQMPVIINNKLFQFCM